MPDETEISDSTTVLPLTGAQQENLQSAQTALLQAQQQLSEEQQTMDMIVSTILTAIGVDGELQQILSDQQMLIVGGEQVRLSEVQAEKIQQHQSNIQDLQPLQQKRQERFEDLVDVYLDLEGVDADPEDIQIFEDRIEVDTSEGNSSESDPSEGDTGEAKADA